MQPYIRLKYSSSQYHKKDDYGKSKLCNCEESLKEGNIVKLYPKGCETIDQASEKRGDSIEVKEGDRAHKNAGNMHKRT